MTFELSVDSKGIDKLINKLENLEENLVAEYTREVSNEAYKIAPVDTGAGRESFTPIENEIYTLEHMIYQDQGTRYIEPKYFFRRAAETASNKLPQIVKDLLNA